MRLSQIVAIAGDGKLGDDNLASYEFRTYLSRCSPARLASFIDECLGGPINDGGLILQDVANEMARRLGFDVTNGRYRGVINQIGFDGLWRSSDGFTIVAEIKTTDAYRLSLDVLANYRRRLIDTGQASQQSSVLVIVGRSDTGELEAQVRGSRHAWDMRVISLDALTKMMLLAHSSDHIDERLKELLRPTEYTRLDKLVDLIFFTRVAEGDEGAPDVDVSMMASSPVGPATTAASNLSKADHIRAKRAEIVRALDRQYATSLVAQSRALWKSDRLTAVVNISKRYDKGGYWYAFHPTWNEFLGEGAAAIVALGCLDRATAFAIPVERLRAVLPKLNRTENEKGGYWHLRLIERGERVELYVPKGDSVPLSPFEISIG